jgi:tripartite-type tricarboxylate transporter receptor subunit TctC
MNKTHISRRNSLRILGGAVALPLVGTGGQAMAQSYPAKPVRLVVPFPPGGTTDIVARLIGEKLTAQLGQPFVIDNRAGAGGNVGAEMVAKAPADGYTLLMGTVGTHAINKFLYKKLAFDPVASFAPVSLVVSVPNVLVVPVNSPFQTAKELLAAAKAKPGGLSMGSAGNGTSLHLSGVLLSKMTGVANQHVPYRGSGPVLTDLMGGQIDYAFDNLPSAMPLIRAGKLRALAVTSLKPSPLLPDVPTMDEAMGLRHFDTSSWFALYAPAHTPEPIVNQLARAVSTATKDRATYAQLVNAGCNVVGSDPRQLEKHMQFEMQKWSALVFASGAKLD